MRASPIDPLEAPARILFEATPHQRTGDSAGVRRQRVPIRLARDDRRQRVGHRLSVERARAGEHFIQDDAERPDVGATVDALSARLLGGHVGRCPEDHPHLRHGRRGDRGSCLRIDGPRFQRLRESEIEHLHGAARPHFDVRRLEIAMDDPDFVGGLERVGDLPCDRSASATGIGPRSIIVDRSSPSTNSITSARVFPDQP